MANISLDPLRKREVLYSGQMSPEELHQMARMMRIKRSWFHGDHYDLNHDMRMKAISLGAKPVPWRFMLKNMIKSRKHAGVRSART